MSSRRQILLATVNWYLQYSSKHIKITGNKSYNRGGRYRQVSLYTTLCLVDDTMPLVKMVICFKLDVKPMSSEILAGWNEYVLKLYTFNIPEAATHFHHLETFEDWVVFLNTNKLNNCVYLYILLRRFFKFCPSTYFASGSWNNQHIAFT